LVDAGHDVIGVNRSREAVDRHVQHGGRAAGSIAEAVTEADVVITMVPDSPDVEGAAYGDDGIYGNAKPETLHIDCSSIRPDVARQLAEAGSERGLRVIDAPVSGGQAGAVEANLSIMVGGADSDVERARPLLEKMGKTVVHVGPAGSGQTVKAANQLIVAGHLQLLAEAIVFLEAHNVDTDAAIKVLGGGLAGSTVLDRKAASMLQRTFDPGFRVDLHHKDLGIVTSSARAAGVAIPLGAQLAELMGSLRSQGHGQLDHSALLMLVEQLSGRASNAPTQNLEA
ncbi:MAG: NAD-binding protein, partial [Propionibacteriales bacterium]|nr:NAD-binding protein [Propionibacteriales bacterium]